MLTEEALYATTSSGEASRLHPIFALEASARRTVSSSEKRAPESPHVQARGHPTTTTGTLVSGSAPMRKIWDYLGR